VSTLPDYRGIAVVSIIVQLTTASPVYASACVVEVLLIL